MGNGSEPLTDRFAGHATQESMTGVGLVMTGVGLVMTTRVKCDEPVGEGCAFFAKIDLYIRSHRLVFLIVIAHVIHSASCC